MPPKDLLAIVAAENESVIAAAQALSDRWSAHAALLHVTELPVPVGSETAFTADLWAEIVSRTRNASAAERERIAQRASLFTRVAEIRTVETLMGDGERVAAFHALYADLTLVPRPTRELETAVFEGALFRSGRPVLVIPPEWKNGPLGKRILVAWAPKREAARALADAAPFLSEAEHVSIVTIDAAPSVEDTGAPGIAVSTHLARHEIDVELRQIDSLGRSAEDALLAEAQAVDADLIVMGGYGHSRLRQFILGGATRGMLEKSPLPVLMSH